MAVLQFSYRNANKRLDMHYEILREHSHIVMLEKDFAFYNPIVVGLSDTSYYGCGAKKPSPLLNS